MELLKVKGLVKHFDISGGFLDQIKIKDRKIQRIKTLVHAVNGIDFNIEKGETLCMVGESGCGKSTVARTLLGLYPPNAGEIYYNDKRIDGLCYKEMMPFRRKMQMVFQDPYASLNPRMKVKEILEEPVRLHFKNLSKKEVEEKVAKVMLQVGVDPTWITRFPHEFSGGQRQRISIARALVIDPEFIVADEPISALDVSIQAQILNLMMDAQDQLGLTYLFITHDLSVVEHIGTRVAVMYLGHICELATTKELFSSPKHPYTQALLSAIPRLKEDRPNFIKLNGEVPTPINLPTGCVFHGRCPIAKEHCKIKIPKLRKLGNGTFAACHEL